DRERGTGARAAPAVAQAGHAAAAALDDRGLRARARLPAGGRADARVAGARQRPWEVLVRQRLARPTPPHPRAGARYADRGIRAAAALRADGHSRRPLAGRPRRLRATAPPP